MNSCGLCPLTPGLSVLKGVNEDNGNKKKVE